MLSRIVGWFLSLAVLLFLPNALSFAQEPVQIAAAADLQPLLPAILARFKASQGIEVVAAYGSSATLAAQVINGAPFALFLSADVGFAQRVVDAQLADGDKPKPYAQGALVLWERKDGPVQPLTLDALRSSAVRAVAIADAQHAPYGRAAIASLTKLGLLEINRPKLKTAENIGQAAQFAESGNAQLGLISLTAALTPKLQAEGTFVKMPADSYPPIIQTAVILCRDQAVESKARAFLTYLLSPAIQQELGRHGLAPAP